MSDSRIDQGYPYHSLKAEETTERLNSSREGLSDEEAKKRLEKYGENKLPEQNKTNILELIIKQFKDFLVLILVIAAIVAWISGSMIDVYVIIGVILVNASIGFTQEYRAEKAVQALKSMIKQEAVAIRNGESKVVESVKLVPGDIIELDEGKSIPADARIIEKKNLQVEESSLTGESVPVDKETEPLDEETSLPDRKNMIFKGTYVARGTCKAVVTATGEHTELGKIAESLHEVEEQESNFRKKTAQLAKIMAGIAVSTALAVFIIGYVFRDFSFDDILLVTIASLVSAIPEGLPAVLSVVLAIGANRMAKQNAIIREFTATESAGSLNVIISDKTGTITKSMLTVKKIMLPDESEFEVSGSGYTEEGEISRDEEKINPGDNPLLDQMLLIAAYCNDASVEQPEDKEDPEVSGDPTELALLVLSLKAGIKDVEEFGQAEKLDDLPFNSEQKFRASLLKSSGDKRQMLFMGAPEKMLELSKSINTKDGPEDLDEQNKKAIKEKIQKLSSQAMRVIAGAYKAAGDDKEAVDAEDAEGLTFAGLYGIIDPARPEVAAAIEECKSAGIRVIMATGDHKETATAIATKVGIIEEGAEGSEDCPVALEESELDVDDEKFREYTDCTNVFARVSPETKLRIAKTLQQKDILIGMTGDGVNDAPALKVADVGIAMGKRGTDVARDASQIVLSDDNFASIVNAIRQGRIVFRNVRLASYFLITTNFASALTLISAMVVGFTYPLLPTQILWINLVTDGIMDISLATEPDHGDMMKEKPLKKSEPILNKQIIPYLLIIVPVMVILALLVFDHYIGQGVEKARTGVFLVVAMSQVFNAFNMRSLTRSVFSIGFFRNKWLILAFVASILLQIAAIKLPFIQHIFHFRDIAWVDIAVITALSGLVFVFGELYKLIRNMVKN